MLSRKASLPPERLIKLATYASTSVAATILVIKCVAWVATDSLSLLTSLVDSTLDILSSLINMAAVQYALRPADHDHRFGHGKAEDIAALTQSAFIAGSAIFIGFEAIVRTFHPRVIEYHLVGIVVMIASVILTAGLVAFQRHVIRRTRSTIIQADSLHYYSDVMVNIAIIASLAISWQWGIQWVDGVLAFAIAFYILHSAWNIGQRSFHHLMDREWEDDKRQKILNIAFSIPEVKGVHQLRTRDSGLKSFIQLHLEMDGKMTLHEAHRISDRVEDEIHSHFPNAEVLIHLDPSTIRELHAASI